jgi:hypothetical protein
MLMYARDTSQSTCLTRYDILAEGCEKLASLE